jgi:hypothetical protein
MERREAMARAGAAAAALAVGTATTGRADHPEKPTAGVPGPLAGFHAYLCAFHLGKKDTRFVVEAHHYCAAVGGGLHQCVVFDKPGKGAKLLGVEYIVTDAIYQKLPADEKMYWHPHRYEVASGLLLAPGLPAADEKGLMDFVVTTWGKTWHTWPDPTTSLPLGEPLLMWAATKDGQVSADDLARRDKQLGVDTAAIRKRRAYLGPVPQIEPPKSIDEVGRQQ